MSQGASLMCLHGLLGSQQEDGESRVFRQYTSKCKGNTFKEMEGAKGTIQRMGKGQATEEG